MDMEITKVKGGRIAKYRYRESMNEKAPEVAERNSKRNCLGMCRSSEKLSRRPGSEMMWPSGGGSRTGNHKVASFGTIATALVQTVARSVEGRTAGVRRACTRKEICRLPAGVQARRVPGRALAGPESSVRPIGGPRGVRQYPIKYACLRQYPIEQDFRGRDAHGCVQHPGATAHACCD